MKATFIQVYKYVDFNSLATNTAGTHKDQSHLLRAIM